MIFLFYILKTHVALTYLSNVMKKRLPLRQSLSLLRDTLSRGAESRRHPCCPSGTEV